MSAVREKNTKENWLKERKKIRSLIEKRRTKRGDWRGWQQKIIYWFESVCSSNGRLIFMWFLSHHKGHLSSLNLMRNFSKSISPRLLFMLMIRILIMSIKSLNLKLDLYSISIRKCLQTTRRLLMYIIISCDTPVVWEITAGNW